MSTRDQHRQVDANLTITLDGRLTGPGGNEDMGWVVPHVFTDPVRDLLDRSISTVTTAVMASVNAEGYAVVWPPVADDREADDRDRAFSRGSYVDEQTGDGVVALRAATGADR